MTVRTGICIVALASCTAWAQAGPVGVIATVNKQVKPASSATSRPTGGKATQTPAIAPAKKPMPAPANAKSPAKKADKATTETDKEKAQATQTATPDTGVIKKRGQRDPFETVVQTESIVTCTTGKKCLVVGSIDLKGTVQTSSGMIAVVENQRGKSYFLHENDPVFNGQVVKINSESIVFRETVTDKAGRQSEKEVVKKLNGPPAG